MPRESNAKSKAPALRGLGQLTLVEHSLCPLDTRASLRPNLTHKCHYRYVDPTSGPSTARVVVSSPRGLAARDEFYLWGLLGITFAQQDPSADLYVTPHYCLRQLGIIEGESKGGESYRLFREALRRLAAVHYENNRFYDPMRREYREVAFGFFSYSLPTNPESNRAWRIVWDPLFFEVCQASGSRLGFDLVSYRRMDPASRRLFLLLKKIFWRRELSPRFDLRQLGVEVLGFSADLETWRIKQKVQRCADVLMRMGVVLPPQPGRAWSTKRSEGRYTVRFRRGPNIVVRQNPATTSTLDSPLHDPLRAIGFNGAEIARILSRYPARQVQLWSDVTLAAIEHRGMAFFRKSPQAFFRDNVQNAAGGARTAPDWFLAIRKAEEQGEAGASRNRQRSKSQGKSQESPRAGEGLSKGIRPEEVQAVVAAMMGRKSIVSGDAS